MDYYIIESMPLLARNTDTQVSIGLWCGPLLLWRYVLFFHPSFVIYNSAFNSMCIFYWSSYAILLPYTGIQYLPSVPVLFTDSTFY